MHLQELLNDWCAERVRAGADIELWVNKDRLWSARLHEHDQAPVNVERAKDLTEAVGLLRLQWGRKRRAA